MQLWPFPSQFELYSLQSFFVARIRIREYFFGKQKFPNHKLVVLSGWQEQKSVASRLRPLSHISPINSLS
jgi:hypothetical protein